MDEEHFRLVHVEIEARAAPALAQLEPLLLAAQQARAWGARGGQSRRTRGPRRGAGRRVRCAFAGVLQGDAQTVEAGLRTVAATLERMQAVLARMG